MKGNTDQQAMLAAIKQRRASQPFGYGISTADRYIRQAIDDAGSDACSRYFNGTHLRSALSNARRKLTFCYEAPKPEKAAIRADFSSLVPAGIEVPDNALMVIRHIVTSTREDRDGDILHTEGAQLDPRAPLLWQHIANLPLGKVLAITEHTADVLKVATVLLDMNDLTSDAATLIEADVLRFSHGFRPLEYSQRSRKGMPEDMAQNVGFDVTKFEIMEVSLVSVPSNVDAEIELYSSNKLTSAYYKAHAERAMKARRKVTAKGHSFEAVTTMTAEKAPTVNVQTDSVDAAMALIDAGKFITPDAWNAPTAQAENDYIAANDVASFGRWHLGIREGVDPSTKGAFAFIYTSDFENVDRAGLVAIRQRSAGAGYDNVFEVAGTLLDALDAKVEAMKSTAATTAEQDQEQVKSYNDIPNLRGCIAGHGCGNCMHFKPVEGHAGICDAYDALVKDHFVCDSWELTDDTTRQELECEAEYDASMHHGTTSANVQQQDPDANTKDNATVSELETKEVDLNVTDGMIEEAKRGLAWREEYNRGGTQVGVTRARQIINDKRLTPDTWRRVESYFLRHEVDKRAEGFNPGEDGYPSAGRIAWALWGGDAGFSRARSVVESLEREEEQAAKSAADTVTVAQDQQQVVKAGRMLSEKNMHVIKEVADDLNDIMKMDCPRAAIALAERSYMKLEGILSAAKPLDIEDSQDPTPSMRVLSDTPKSGTAYTVTDALVTIMMSSPDAQKAASELLQALLLTQKYEHDAKSFRSLLRP